MLIMPSSPKRKNQVNTSLIRNEKDGGIHNANAIAVTRLSESDKEILKVLLSPDNGTRRSSPSLAKNLEFLKPLL
jgi:hypothetical protein